MTDQHHPTAPSSHPSFSECPSAHPEGLALALLTVAGDLRATTTIAFTDSAGRVFDWIDGRAILQTRIWADRTAASHALTDMSRKDRVNVLGYLRDRAAVWVAQARAWEIAAAIYGLIDGLEARDHLENLDLLTPGWTDHTPLGHQLHRLNRTIPENYTPIAVRTTCATTDTPQILREEHGGHWRITTASTATYLLDLNRGRIMRHPGDTTHATHTGGDGDHPRPPLNQLDQDDDWTDLDHLLRCQIGDGLVVLDRRPDAPAGGYRLSTPITRIERYELSKASDTA